MNYKTYEEFALAVIENGGVCPHLEILEDYRGDLLTKLCTITTKCLDITCPVLADLKRGIK